MPKGAKGYTGSARPTNTTRKPMLSLRFSGSLSLRYADRQFLALLFQEPPRNTRADLFSAVPAAQSSGSICIPNRSVGVKALSGR